MKEYPVLFGFTEPMTLLTDYGLTAISWYFAYKLFKREINQGQSVRKLWALAFLSLGLGAFLGGTHHGFRLILSEEANAFVWSFTTYAIGFSSFFLVLSTAFMAFSGVTRRVICAIAVLKFIVFSVWVTISPLFLIVILDYFPAMLFLLFLTGFSWFCRKEEGAKWLLFGVLISFAGAAVQQSGFDPHYYFNHNDVYHVIQMVGLYMYYRGALLVKDRS